MKEKDVHKLIEEQDKGKKALMYEKFQSKHNLESNTGVVKYNKKRICIASVAATAVIAIFLIIAIPLLINNFNRYKKRYCTTNDCVAIDLNSTVKDYATEVGKDFLYIDWYDIADEVQTKLYVNKNDSNDIVFIQETIINGESGDVVNYYIVDEFTDVDALIFYEENCDRTTTINNISINWYYNNRRSVAVFKYEGYKYYIELKDPMAEEDVLKIVEEMTAK